MDVTRGLQPLPGKLEVQDKAHMFSVASEELSKTGYK
jgi:hypothetical protein